MKKNMIVRMLCNGLIFFSLLLSQNIATAQEAAGENAAQELTEKANRLTSSHKEFHDAVKKVTDAANNEAREHPYDPEGVKQVARKALDEEIKKAKGKPYQSELESLKKRWMAAEMIYVSASDLEKQAWEQYEKGYTEKTPEDKAKAFEEAAKLFEEAAKAYRKVGNDDKAKAMDGQAEAARKNAKAHGPRESKEEGEEDKKAEQHSIQPTSPTWERISLDGANFKVLPTTPSVPRFHIGLIGSLPLGDINTQSVPMTSLQSAVFAPGTVEQLFEQLQGEFFIGSLSGQSAQNFEMSGTTQAMPGLRLGLRLGERLELRAGGHYFQSKWTGNFPVVVFSEQQHPSQPPKTLQGNLSASSSGILAEADLAYFFTSGTIRPFVHGGIRGQFPTQNESGATLSGVAIPLETNPLGSSYSPFGGAGLRVGFLKNGFVEANANYAKVPGGEYAPSVGLSLGWQFGTTQKPGNRPELVSINNGNCECNGANVAFKAKLLRGYINDDGDFKEIDGGECSFDTRTNASSCAATQTVLPRHSVRFVLADLDIKCQDCKVGNCLPTNIKVSVKTSGVAKFQIKKKDKNGKDMKDKDGKEIIEEKNEVTLTAENGYDLGSLKVTDGAGPIRLEITIKYNCGSAESATATQCKKSTECKNEFVIIFNRG